MHQTEFFYKYFPVERSSSQHLWMNKENDDGIMFFPFCNKIIRGLCFQCWHLGASLAISCYAACLVAHLTSLRLLTLYLSLCFFILIVLFGSVIFFSWQTPYSLVLIRLFFYICILCIPSPPSYLLLPHFLFFVSLLFVHFPCFSSLMSSLLQCSPTHLGWHHSHHAVAVPRWTKGWIWFPAVQELHVSRFCQQIPINFGLWSSCLS